MWLIDLIGGIFLIIIGWKILRSTWPKFTSSPPIAKEQMGAVPATQQSAGTADSFSLEEAILRHRLAQAQLQQKAAELEIDYQNQLATKLEVIAQNRELELRITEDEIAKRQRLQSALIAALHDLGFADAQITAELEKLENQDNH